jgi:hypothetical protein
MAAFADALRCSIRTIAPVYDFKSSIKCHGIASRIAVARDNAVPADNNVESARKYPELFALAASRVEVPLRAPGAKNVHEVSALSVGSTGSFRDEEVSRVPAEQQSNSARMLKHKPEVLAPAGGWPQLRAAVENGADAVYFGCTGFNARARCAAAAPICLRTPSNHAHQCGPPPCTHRWAASARLLAHHSAANFEPEDLEEVMRYLHSRGVKGYVAVNILVSSELH